VLRHLGPIASPPDPEDGEARFLGEEVQPLRDRVGFAKVYRTTGLGDVRRQAVLRVYRGSMREEHLVSTETAEPTLTETTTPSS
jgi:hypothetical protein